MIFLSTPLLNPFRKFFTRNAWERIPQTPSMDRAADWDSLSIRRSFPPTGGSASGMEEEKRRRGGGDLSACH